MTAFFNSELARSSNSFSLQVLTIAGIAESAYVLLSLSECSTPDSDLPKRDNTQHNESEKDRPKNDEEFFHWRA